MTVEQLLQALVLESQAGRAQWDVAAEQCGQGGMHSDAVSGVELEEDIKVVILV